MKVLIIKRIIEIVITVGVLIFILQLVSYRKNKDKYGKNGKKMFRLSLHILYPVIPRLESKRYKSAEKMLYQTGWEVCVEYFYLIKLGLFFSTIVLMYFVTMTNKNLKISNVIHNKAYTQELAKQNINNESIAQDDLLNYFYEKYKDLSNEEAVISIQGELAQMNPGNLEVETNIMMANKIEGQIRKINILTKSYKEYVFIFLYGIVVFYIPDMLGLIRYKLIENTKNWEAIYAMVVYLVFGSLPPYRVDRVLKNIKAVTNLYKSKINKFDDLITKGKDKEIIEFIKTIENDNMEEVLEILHRSKKTGLLDSTKDIEELYQTSRRMMDIESIKKRQFKFFICMIPATIVFIWIIIYFQYGSTLMLNQSYLNF